MNDFRLCMRVCVYMCAIMSVLHENSVEIHDVWIWIWGIFTQESKKTSDYLKKS